LLFAAIICRRISRRIIILCEQCAGKRIFTTYIFRKRDEGTPTESQNPEGGGTRNKNESWCTLTKDAVFKKYGNMIDVDNKLAIDAVFGNNMGAFTEPEDKNGDTKDGDSDDDSGDSGGLESNNGEDVSAAVIGRGYTKEENINEEDLAISYDESDLEGDAAASFSFASLMNARPVSLDDDDEVLSDLVTLESMVTVEEMTWFNTHIGGDLRRAVP
jgi:hypothetical protein